ncbi:chaperonin 10-like protein [Aspergillus novoparasiticus]|uniref:Chaperonin 10-like protein n=1 Tax=Aspergillus novoparasiticus TaxID=986946 RepID=A0A5N6ERW2_9EURO|nr:chaperonin 10-like protein [Aspergillus novoparasiticus]
MEEAQVFVRNDTVDVRVHNVPIPKPGAGQILIKVVATGTNPKDWKFPAWMENFNGANTGDDIAGYVHEIGEGVSGFQVGDRVAAYHDYTTPHGSYAEYAIGEDYATFHIPDNIPFEQAATVPLAAMTASLALFSRLGLPEPWFKEKAWSQKPEGGVLVYGAASAVGTFAIKLLQKADIHPIICVAGRGKDFARSHLDESKGDVVIDYREGESAVVTAIRKASQQLRYALDAVSEKASFSVVSQVLDPDCGAMSVVSPVGPEECPEKIRVEFTDVGRAHKDEKEFAYVWSRFFTLGLREGWLTPHPHELIPGGLQGVQIALTNLKEGKASALKYVLKIKDN